MAVGAGFLAVLRIFEAVVSNNSPKQRRRAEPEGRCIPHLCSSGCRRMESLQLPHSDRRDARAQQVFNPWDIEQRHVVPLTLISQRRKRSPLHHSHP